MFRLSLSALVFLAVIGSAFSEPYLALDDSRVQHQWRKPKLRDSWKPCGLGVERKLATITSGTVDFRTSVCVTNGSAVTVSFLGPDRVPVCEKVIACSHRQTPVHIRFDVQRPIAFLRLTPDAAHVPWSIVCSPLRLTVDLPVYETFDGLGSDATRMPDGWTGVSARVTTVASAVATDPHLELSPGGRAEVSFAPVAGKRVVSFQTLADARSTLNVTLPSGATVVLRGQDFTFPGGVSYAARSNVWYTLRFETVAPEGRMRIKLNGREIGWANVGSANSGKLAFSASGARASRIDDVRVFPSVTHADGVPEPVVPRDSKGHVVGINICSLWHEGSHLGWDCIARCETPRPVLGFYDEGEGESADWEIKYMVEHGIDFQAFCWYAEQSNAPIKHPQLAYQLDDGFKNAKWSDKMGYCLIWECANAAVPLNARAWREFYVPYFIEHHFKDPRYMKIRNRLPLFAFAGGWKVAKAFGDIPTMRREFDYLEEKVRELGFDGMIYVLSNNASRGDFAKMGYDATAAYNWGGAGFSFNVNTNRNWRNAADRNCFTIPTISVGFNNEPWGGTKKPMMTPEVFEQSLTWARDVFSPATARKGTWQENLFMISTWNEYGEGTYIMPTEDARGFGYLDAVRKVFTDEAPDARLNLRPTAEQRRRIGRLYRP